MLNGYTAYKSVQNKTEEPRDIEYRLLAQVTASLIAARDNPKEFQKRVEAVLWNRDVWSAFRVDLSDADNKLPKELRASLLSISIWMEKETHAILDQRGDIDAVIDINRNIMAGLKPDSQSSYEPGIS
jgi:flagellar protein FlaF